MKWPIILCGSKCLAIRKHHLKRNESNKDEKAKMKVCGYYER